MSLNILKNLEIECTLEPFLDTYNKNKYHKKELNKNIINYILKNKLNKIKYIIKENVFYTLNIKKYNFDKANFVINLTLYFTNFSNSDIIPAIKTKNGSKYYLNKPYKEKVLIKEIEKYIKELIIDNDSEWSGGDIEILEPYEIDKQDNNTYDMHFHPKKIIGKFKKPMISENKKNRPSPSESATLFEVGTIKKGNDKNKYIIVKDKNGVKKWKLFN